MMWMTANTNLTLLTNLMDMNKLSGALLLDTMAWGMMSRLALRNLMKRMDSAETLGYRVKMDLDIKCYAQWNRAERKHKRAARRG